MRHFAGLLDGSFVQVCGVQLTQVSEENLPVLIDIESAMLFTHVGQLNSDVTFV